MPGPLSGIKVLDLSAVVAGPLTAVLLADQGADVIKVERLEGDIQRHVGSSRNGFSGNFHMLNRGKRSLALDLKRSEARDIVGTLADWADVAIQNFRPGVVDRLGVGYEQLKQRNPRLIYLSLSGFGPSGPHAGRRAYDPIIQARSGAATAQGRGEDGGPQQVKQLLADKITAYAASQAISAALVARERLGGGQHITLSMLDAVICFLWPDVGADQILLGEGIDERPPIGAAGHVARFANGWAATMTLSDAEYQGMCRAYGVPELADDPRFSTVRARQQNRLEYRATLDRVASEKAAVMSIEDAEERFQTHNAPFGRVNDIEDLPNDEQVLAGELFETTDHPVAGRLRQTRPAPRFSDTPAGPGKAAPTIGEHSRQILIEVGLGDRIDELVDGGIVGVEE
ncbi:MAG: CoA transferase [Acidobacteriota bacterium]|nr:CoA transferase [Acidobacteriota bacterium]